MRRLLLSSRETPPTVAELSEIFADIRERKAGKRRQGKEEA